MRASLLIGTGAVAVAAIAIAVGCQTYDFEPVQPLAVAQTTQTFSTIGRSFRPNMALLVDKSGSMKQAVDPFNSACDIGAGLPSKCGQTGQSLCPASCPTRWGDLNTAMQSFLVNNGTVARFGLALYPASSGQCAPASTMSVPVSTSNDVNSELQATANQILSTVAGTTPSGGTPTADSVRFVATNATLADSQRDNFILLLTDGLPNCNLNNPNTYAGEPDTTCRCTDTNTSSCTAAPKLLCLDADATVAAIDGVRTTQNIRTIVVGFGAETSSGDGPDVLRRMALAGGFPRTCSGGTDAECGLGGVCDPTSKTCNPPFYQATNATDLAAVLAKIAKTISQTPCNYFLAVTPSKPEFISVL
ncbi:MAG TPA: adventurous gliding motility lipoprotein CglB, partial [Myxococcales bacterium]|nr:adventurous gliding motility lipoprotein CglB [Myxococcales bacterium]